MPREVSSAIDRPKPSTPGNSAAAVMFIRRSSVQKVWLDLIWNDDLLEMGPCDYRRDADVVLMDFQTHRKTSLLFHYQCAGKELDAHGHHAASGGRDSERRGQVLRVGVDVQCP